MKNMGTLKVKMQIDGKTIEVESDNADDIVTLTKKLVNRSAPSVQSTIDRKPAIKKKNTRLGLRKTPQKYGDEKMVYILDHFEYPSTMLAKTKVLKGHSEDSITNLKWRVKAYIVRGQPKYLSPEQRNVVDSRVSDDVIKNKIISHPIKFSRLNDL